MNTKELSNIITELVKERESVKTELNNKQRAELENVYQDNVAKYKRLMKKIKPIFQITETIYLEMDRNNLRIRQDNMYYNDYRFSEYEEEYKRNMVEINKHLDWDYENSIQFQRIYKCNITIWKNALDYIEKNIDKAIENVIDEYSKKTEELRNKI